jgi:apolipoprotein N-acyltransferase
VGLAGAPSELFAVAFLGPALLLAAIEPEPRTSVGPRNGALAGLAFGVACNALTMPWVAGLLSSFAGIPAPLAWALSAMLWTVQALPWALAGWGAAAWTQGDATGWLALPGWLVLPGWIVLAGSVTPMLFPWRLGISQMPGVLFVQSAELGGPPLLDLLMALGACAALHALRERRARTAAVATAAIVAPLLYGALRLPTVRAERIASRALRVGVVQPSIGVEARSDPMLRESHLARHRTMTTELEAEGAALVLWPESAYPFPLDRSEESDSLQPHRRVLHQGVRGPVLFGALTSDATHRYNSVVALDASGRFTGRYDKAHLLAFGEYTPLHEWLGPLRRVVPRGLDAGGGASTLDAAGVRIGVLDCYEDLLVDHARRTAALDPDFLANFTNDAWFGATAAPHLHHMLARLRAVETRRDMVRAVNSGVSALVLATGEDEHRTAPFERTSFIADVRRLSGTTPWVRWGDLTTPFVAFGLLLDAVRRRLQSLPGPPD